MGDNTIMKNFRAEAGRLFSYRIHMSETHANDEDFKNEIEMALENAYDKGVNENNHRDIKNEQD